MCIGANQAAFLGRRHLSSFPPTKPTKNLDSLIAQASQPATAIFASSGAAGSSVGLGVYGVVRKPPTSKLRALVGVGSLALVGVTVAPDADAGAAAWIGSIFSPAGFPLVGALPFCADANLKAAFAAAAAAFFGGGGALGVPAAAPFEARGSGGGGGGGGPTLSDHFRTGGASPSGVGSAGSSPARRAALSRSGMTRGRMPLAAACLLPDFDPLPLSVVGGERRGLRAPSPRCAGVWLGAGWL